MNEYGNQFFDNYSALSSGDSDFDSTGNFDNEIESFDITQERVEENSDELSNQQISDGENSDGEREGNDSLIDYTSYFDDVTASLSNIENNQLDTLAIQQDIEVSLNNIETYTLATVSFMALFFIILIFILVYNALSNFFK